MTDTAARTALEQLVAQARQVLIAGGVDPGSEQVHRLLALPSLPGPSAPVASTSDAPHDLFSPAYDSASTATPQADPEGSSMLSLSAQVAAAVRLRQYEPPPARRWTAHELARSKNVGKYTREKRCAAVIDHPLGAIVEYPETGSQLNEAVAHRFQVDPHSAYRPQHSFQYSLSDSSHGGNPSVNCWLIRDGEKVLCKSTDYGCGCVRMCSFSGRSSHVSEAVSSSSGHSYTSPTRASAIRAAAHAQRTQDISVAEIEVFRKTLAFFGALTEHGCSVEMMDLYSEPDDEEEYEDIKRDARCKLRSSCSGRIVLKRNSAGHAYLECEHRTKGRCDHLIVRNLQDFDIDYLAALLSDDKDVVLRHEQRAAAAGYGPLAPCQHTRSCRTQAQLCPDWHRGDDGQLRRGEMKREFKCTARFRIFEPLDLVAHPCIVVICTSPHVHQAPERSMTPPLLRDALESLLCDMRWRLADATPRRIVRDSGFMSNLRHLLNWSPTLADPVLSDLHPSLGNLDHVAYLIDVVRRPLFPLGTDFEGVRDMYNRHLSLPAEDRYVRYVAEKALSSNGKLDRIVICMFPSQSRRLLSTKRLDVDISYKGVKGWYEFQMEAWDSETSQSVTLCRAFTTSQSAEAFRELYRQILSNSDSGRRR
ncbi:hypothetical protein EXIGLDRAFT_843006 [Exidia glandulosa HHB12029]|uniref:Uncharacterized protein n=1 Tax=Exidia glandulosa HHB12029 TaxID=1314781 RepID=A0A165CXM7_EXIGL|nr:hypothetical protein EXIGLDRAFT_843006 [Exidia glandulosa HHB12029]